MFHRKKEMGHNDRRSAMNDARLENHKDIRDDSDYGQWLAG